MTIILLITICCFILYNSHVMRPLMAAARMKPAPADMITETRPETLQQQKHAGPILAAKTPALGMDRKKAEKVAANIMLYNGYKKDAFSLARRATDAELYDIIERFKNDIL